MKLDKPPRTDSAYEAPWERAFERITTPFEEFIHNQTSSGLILMGSTLLALVLANSALAPMYEHFFHMPLRVGFGTWGIEKTLHHWINDGLMALFFFLVGLEIKREVLVGELASIRQAALPIIAAIGGMVVPAVVYTLINPEGDAARGWAIPMATDIAFAVGALVLLGRRIPTGLMMFLVALAIVDDLGSVLVIALFYTETVQYQALAVAGGLFGLLVVLNLGGIRRPLPYFIIGVLLWLAMLESGIHATIAGVLVALAIPAKPRYDPERFSAHMRELLDQFDESGRPGVGILRNVQQRSIVQTLENGIRMVETPLQRLEHAFHVPVGLLIVPVFAVANAGIPISTAAVSQVFAEPIALGVIGGLIVGKFLGITGASWLALRMGIARLPNGATMRHVAGVGLLGGIGFTMSIFIDELAFGHDPNALLMAKTGILFASVIAGFAGYVWLRWFTRVDEA